MQTFIPEWEEFKKLYCKGCQQILTSDEYNRLDELETWIVACLYSKLERDNK